MRYIDLLNEVEEFNGMTPTDAINLIGKFLLELDQEETVDKRLSDAVKRIKKLIDDIESTNALDMYIQDTIQYRLDNVHQIKYTQDDINNIDYKYVNNDDFIKTDYLDKQIKKYYEDKIAQNSKYKIDNMTLNRIATYIFVDTCETSQSGNNIVYLSEIERIFNVIIIKTYYKEICNILRTDFATQVLDLNDNNDDYYFEKNKYFDITIGGYYTIYGDTDYEEEGE